MSNKHPKDNGQELLQLDGSPATDEARLAHFAFMEIKYKNQRLQEYPPITDYLDGVVKGDQEQIDAYIAACQAVKAKYPKPE